MTIVARGTDKTVATPRDKFLLTIDTVSGIIFNMASLKEYPNCVALLADVVGSRLSDRVESHAHVLAAIARTNEQVPALDPLRVTVGDELQGVYATLGGALHARTLLVQELADTVDLRFGLGGGDVQVVDAERGIQDGSAWWLAREAITWVEDQAGEPGYSAIRTEVRDDRAQATPGAGALVRLTEVSTSRLRAGTRRTLTGLLAGLDNNQMAKSEGISPSANSQRVNNNDLRVLADAVVALWQLP